MRRYRRLKLVVVVGIAVALLSTGGATADPRIPFLPPPENLTEPLRWANPAATAPGGAGVTPQVTRIPLGSFEKPAPGVAARAGLPEAAPSSVTERYRRAKKVRTLSVTRQSTGPFSAVGVTWREVGRVGTVTVAVRHHVPGGGWSAWRTADTGEADRDLAPGRQQRGGADLVWTGKADGVQLAVTTTGGPAPHDITADLIDPTDAPGDAAQTPPAPPVTESQLVGLRPFMPAILRRAAWGANEQQMNWQPQYAQYVKAVALHHTATGNDYSPEDVPKILRSIYQYQTVSRGWGDIGYNVLVDRFGRLWEGRSGGLSRPVVGAQAGGFNTGTAGVAMIGDFRTVNVPQVVQEATAQYTAWKLSLRQAIDPRGTVSLTGGGSTSRYPTGTTVTAPRVFPHRQTNRTECPGDKGVAALPWIRERAGALTGDMVKPEVVRTLLAVYRPADGTVRLQGVPEPVFTSAPNEIPVAADYNGDGRADVATWSPVTGNWSMLLSGEGRRTVQWGLPGDLPAPADFDGDGTAELAVFRPATGVWYIKGAGEVVLGQPGDVPVPADYTGDGRAEVAIWRPSTGLWAIKALREFKIGGPGEFAAPADYDGDGIVEPATWSPASQQFTIDGQPAVRFGAAGPTVRPVVAQYDGDGRADPAVFHDGRYDIRGAGGYDVGAQGDIPMPLS
ncbi:FG-GAP-like repeat-containing protein [Dactylosporangium sp. NPDC050688]|uniref:FG-GAP-like repeat-containing protein n=1 Tax=Dactylosporangium sp. NPDC050688 TaxID=3157217 RepID=UPI0034078381